MELPPSAFSVASACESFERICSGFRSFAAALRKTSAPTSARSWPVMTASCTIGSAAAMSFTRTMPTLTQVPVESLKSSATRPSNTMPFAGSRGSASFTASPMRHPRAHGAGDQRDRPDELPGERAWPARPEDQQPGRHGVSLRHRRPPHRGDDPGGRVQTRIHLLGRHSGGGGAMNRAVSIPRHLARLLSFFTMALATGQALALSVSLTAPAAGSASAPGSSTPVSANAPRTNGQRPITKVEFFAGTTLTGTDTTSPYSIVWANVPSGTYSLTAKVTDSTGATATSAARTIRVNTLPS